MLFITEVKREHRFCAPTSVAIENISSSLPTRSTLIFYKTQPDILEIMNTEKENSGESENRLMIIGFSWPGI